MAHDDGGDAAKGDIYLSEVHISGETPTLKTQQTRFWYWLREVGGSEIDEEASKAIDVDDDDDLIVARKPKDVIAVRVDNEDEVQRYRQHYLTIWHQTHTSLERVGLQVWRGGLYLCDYLLNLFNEGALDLNNGTVLELGAGTGFVGLLCAHLGTQTTIITDKRDPEILALADRNAFNCRQILSKENLKNRKIIVCAMPWGETIAVQRDELQHAYGWAQETISKLDACRLILAADCIYDPESTELLFTELVLIIEFLAQIETFDFMAFRILISAERRVNFAVGSTCPEAPALAHFESICRCIDNSNLKELRSRLPFDMLAGSFCSYPEGKSSVTGSDRERLSPAQGLRVTARLIGCQNEVPRMMCYDRSDSLLELWEIRIVE